MSNNVAKIHRKRNDLDLILVCNELLETKSLSRRFDKGEICSLAKRMVESFLKNV